jgi:3-hydroxyisobutyrate dehydrogenase-like beta-hydroxyacid dehydrogenase
MSTAIDPGRVALIGFGEVGGIFAQGLVASGRHSAAAYDILLDDPARAEAVRHKARSLGVAACGTAAEAAAGARIVISAVTAAAARTVAEQAASYLGPGQLFLDINSVSPEAKRANAAAVERSGAAYVEAAVMAPVPPYGMTVPILLGGSRAGEVAAILNAAGMAMTVASAEIGQASAIKMCRSIMIKGLEALTVECMMTARQYGVEDTIIASLDESFPGFGWEKRAGYMIGRVVQHGRRRAAEVREVAETIRGVGLDPLMASATAERQDWIADLAAELPEARMASDGAWRTTVDALVARFRSLKSPKAAE